MHLIDDFLEHFRQLFVEGWGFVHVLGEVLGGTGGNYIGLGTGPDCLFDFLLECFLVADVHQLDAHLSFADADMWRRQ